MNPNTFQGSAAARPRPELIQSLHGAYDTARLAWNLAADQRPEAVAPARSAADVQEVVRFAAERGLKVAPQGTGHLATALPSLENTILLKTKIPGVDVDVDRRRARVGAGTVWEEVVEAIAPHGLTALHGSSPDVGVVGYTLGGGLSFYAREYGLAANHVTAIEVVTADGEMVRADHDRNADLFWALRGGGGNFGVVTHIEFALFPVADVFAGMVAFPAAHAREVFERWHRWSATAPSTVTTSIRLMQLPPLDVVPEPLRDVPIVVVDGASLGAEADAEAAVRDLREMGIEPIVDTFAYSPSSAVLRIHGDPEDPMPGASASSMPARVDTAMIDALVTAVEPHLGTSVLLAELRQLGGAIAASPADGGACCSFDEEALFFVTGLAPDPAAIPAQLAVYDAIAEAIAPWDSGRRYLNFDERHGDGRTSYGDEAYERLARIRAEVDPDERFTASHRIVPAGR